MIEPDIQHLEIERGTDYTLTYTYSDRVTGLPINLTGATVSFSMSSRKYPDVVGSTKTLGSGITVTTPTNGVITVTFPASETATGTTTLTEVTYGYDLFVVSGGVTVKVLKGLVTILDTVG